MIVNLKYSTTVGKFNLINWPETSLINISCVMTRTWQILSVFIASSPITALISISSLRSTVDVTSGDTRIGQFSQSEQVHRFESKDGVEKDDTSKMVTRR